MNNLSDLISGEENYFNVDDYLDVGLIYSVTRRHRQLRFNYSFLVSLSDYDASFQQVSSQHHRLVDERSVLFRAHPLRRAWLVLHIQFTTSILSFAKVLLLMSAYSIVFMSILKIAFFSFLISGNLENSSRVKSLEEISYFDGDANAVTTDLTHNVDVKVYIPFRSESCKYVHQSRGSF